ncbi:MAG: NADH-quinone oxidoreductase subunit NuoH [Candidatus Melainabacteria bacterium]
MYDSAVLQTFYPTWLPSLLNALIRTWNALPFGDIQIVWPPEVLLLIWAVILFTLIAVVAQASVIFMVLMERKVLAWVTQRKGPNRVGPWGLLQTLADGVKLLFKEDIMHSGQDKFLFTIAPAIFFLPTFVFLALIPFTEHMLAVALPAGALFVFALSSISVIGMVLAGWASNNKYSLIGGMRSAAQAISYEIPLVMSVLAVVLYTGTMNISEIVMAQQGGLSIPFAGIELTLIPNWFFLTLTPISFVIFAISAIAEVNRIPFDLPEAESELVSGYNTEYTGMKFALFFLAEYAALFAMCGFTVSFFLGGYLSPVGFYLVELPAVKALLAATGIPQIGGLVLQIEMLFWFLAKTYLFIFIAMWVRGTLPRLKPDQLMGFSWKFLIPLSLVNLFVICLQKYWHVGWNMPLELKNLLAWGTIVVLAFGGFFIFSSRYLSKKLEARLIGR